MATSTPFLLWVLYHLDRPADFVRLVAACAAKVLILNTHFATTQTNDKFPLRDIVELDGIKGRWFHEYGEGTEDVEAFKWGAWSNRRSFWPRRAYIPQMLTEAGLDLVFKQVDWMGQDIAESISHRYHATDNRGTFAGVRPEKRTQGKLVHFVDVAGDGSMRFPGPAWPPDALQTQCDR